jgi:hypothetical protein
MTSRTPTAKHSDTPALHGHYDGPRGHTDEHRHPAGDKPHGHHGDRHLGRVAETVEYVHGDQLPEARRVASLAEVDTTQPLDQRTTGAALVKATSATSDSDRYARGVKIAQHLQTLRFENETEIECMSLLDQAQRQTDSHQPVDADVVRKLRVLAESWETQRGLNGDGGS